MTLRFTYLVFLILSCFAIAACGQEQTSAPGTTAATAPDTVGPACGGTNAPAACGSPCSSPTECGGGTYCNVSVCAADCTSDGEQCIGSTECNPNTGRCVATEQTSGSCASVNLTGQSATPNLVFLVDNSGSMGNDFPGSKNRWLAVRNFLVGSPTAFVPQRGDQLKMGLSLYSAYSAENSDKVPADPVPENKKKKNCVTPPGQQCPQVCSVAPLANAYGTLSDPNNYPGSHFGDDTPTGDSLDFLVDTLVDDPDHRTENGVLVDRTGEPFSIILATDGAPDRCEAVNPNNIDDNPEAYSEAEAAAARAFTDYGIRVYTVYVGKLDSNKDRAHMNRVACLGVGEDRNCAENASGDRFFEVTNADDLSEAITSVAVSEVVSCRVNLGGQLIVRSDEQCPEGGFLKLDSVNNEKDRNLLCGEDWKVLNPSTIEVVGQACNDLKEPGSKMSGTFPCGAAKVI